MFPKEEKSYFLSRLDVIQSASQHYSSDGYLLIQIEMRISTDKMSASILILATCHQVLADFNSYVVPQPHAQVGYGNKNETLKSFFETISNLFKLKLVNVSVWVRLGCLWFYL